MNSLLTSDVGKTGHPYVEKNELRPKAVVVVNKERCEYKGAAQGSFGGDGTVLYPNSHGCYIC